MEKKARDFGSPGQWALTGLKSDRCRRIRSSCGNRVTIPQAKSVECGAKQSLTAKIQSKNKITFCGSCVYVVFKLNKHAWVRSSCIYFYISFRKYSRSSLIFKEIYIFFVMVIVKKINSSFCHLSGISIALKSILSLPDLKPEITSLSNLDVWFGASSTLL